VRGLFPLDDRFLGFGYWMPTVLKRVGLVESGCRLDDSPSDEASRWEPMLWTGHHSSKQERSAGMPRPDCFSPQANGLWEHSRATPAPGFCFYVHGWHWISLRWGFGGPIQRHFFPDRACRGAVGMINSFGNVGGFCRPVSDRLYQGFNRQL